MSTRQRNRFQPKSVRATYDKKSGLVRLNVPLSVKAETIDTSARTFEGLAATWDEDLGSDVIHKGAFKDSIAEWKASEEAMPLLNSHDHFDIFAALGQAISMKETDAGLQTKWEVLEGDDGDKVLQRLRPSPTTGRAIIGKMSIGFIPLKFEFEQPEGTDSFWDRIRHITKATLKEVSLVLFPMNPNASIDAATVKMWLKMAHDQDPKALDQLTRMELRRLNSKIGLLLSKRKPEDDDLEDEDDTDTPPTRKTSVPKTARKDDSDSGDDADDDSTDDDEEDTDDVDEDDDSDDTDDVDDGDDEDDEDDVDEDDVDDEEELDDDETDAGKKTPKSAKAPQVKDKGKKTPKDKKAKDQKDEDKPYEFSEALAQRLKKVSLKNKVSGIGREK